MSPFYYLLLVDGHLSFLEHEHGIHLQLKTKSGVSSPHNPPVTDHLAFEGTIVSVSYDHDPLLGAITTPGILC